MGKIIAFRAVVDKSAQGRNKTLENQHLFGFCYWLDGAKPAIVIVSNHYDRSLASGGPDAINTPRFVKRQLT